MTLVTCKAKTTIRVCLLRNYVQRRSEDFEAEVRAAPGMSAYLDNLQQFPIIKNALQRNCDQSFRDNLCFGRSSFVNALPSKTLQCITLKPSDTQAAKKFGRKLVNAYRDEELGLSDIT